MSNSSNSKPVFDREVGTTESAVLQKYGIPTQTVIKHSSEMVGELREPIRRKVVSEGTEIKELYYKSERGERMFWLTKDLVGQWKVVSDAEVPSGIMF